MHNYVKVALTKYLYIYTMNKLCTTLITGLFITTGFAQTAHHINLIYSWTDTNIAEINAPPSLDHFRYNDVWGYEKNGREYAILGSTEGVHFFDITDTTMIDYVDFVVGNHGPNIHREFNNYNNYLYIVGDQGNSGLQIVDMQYLPDSVHLVYNNDSLTIRAHELHIDTAKQKLYLFGVNSDLLSSGVGVGYPAMILDISSPANPQYLAMFNHNIITYVHDGFVKNDTAFFHSAYNGLYYGYMGDPQNPVELDVMPFYLDQGYNHSGWLTPDGRHYVMMDETQGMRIKMIDMQPGLNFFTVCGLFEAGVDSLQTAHNPHINANYLFASYYQDGVRIFDLTDACNPAEVAWYDTWPGDALPDEYRGAWGVYAFLPSGKILVSDMQTGLYVLRPSMITIGLQENETFSFSLSPNPAADWIQLNEPFETVRIIDMQGQLIKQANNLQQIEISELAAGLYLIGVEKQGNWGYKKFIKE
jgi:choice-of-anchor B domain-containing protein